MSFLCAGSGSYKESEGTRALELGPGLRPSGLCSLELSHLSDLPSKRTHYSPHWSRDQTLWLWCPHNGNPGYLWGPLPQRLIWASQAGCPGPPRGYWVAFRVMSWEVSLRETRPPLRARLQGLGWVCCPHSSSWPTRPRSPIDPQVLAWAPVGSIKALL